MAVNPLSRREVLKFGAYTTVGGVLTPGISLAQAVVTDTKGITARDEQIESGGTKIPIYHAGPEKMAKYPVIVVISGFTGNSEQNKDVCRRFAHAGYYAIAPELYSREGGMQGKDFQQMGAISSKVTRAQYLADVKAFEQTLRSKGNTSVEFVLYPGAPHAFFSDDRPQAYRKDAAEDAWKRRVAFFDKHLKI